MNPKRLPSQLLLNALQGARKQGKSFRDIAALAGIDKNTVINIYRGFPKTLGKLQAVAKALDIEPKDCAKPNPQDAHQELQSDHERFFSFLSRPMESPSLYADEVISFLENRGDALATEGSMLRDELSLQSSRLRNTGDFAGAALCQYIASFLAPTHDKTVQHLVFASKNARYVSLPWKELLSKTFFRRFLNAEHLSLRTQATLPLELGNILAGSDYERHHPYARALYDAAYQKIRAASTAYKQAGEIIPLPEECRIRIRQGYNRIRDEAETAHDFLQESREMLTHFEPGEAMFALKIPTILSQYCIRGTTSALAELDKDKQFLTKGVSTSRKAISAFYEDFARLTKTSIPDELRHVIDTNIAEPVVVEPGGLIACYGLWTSFRNAKAYQPLLTVKQVQGIVHNQQLLSSQ